MAINELSIILNDGRSLALQEQGDRRGRPVIYLHSNPGSHHERGDYDALYTRLGLRYIAVTRPGIGGSSPCEGWSALSFADDLNQLCEQLDIECTTVIGFSAGGLYACAFAQRYPQRVKRLALLSSVSPFDNPELYAKVSASMRPFYEGAKHDPDGLLQQLSGLTTPEAIYGVVASLLSEKDKAILETPALRDAFLTTYGDLLQQGVACYVKEVYNVVTPWGFSPSEITVETRLWHGTADINVPIECSEYLAEQIPSAKANYVEGAGHYFSFAQWKTLVETIVRD